MIQSLAYAGTDTVDPTRAASRFARVVPLAFVSYSLAYLDRVNYGYATAGGMPNSLHLSPFITSLLPALFFVGYCLFQIPAANWASRRNVKWLVFWALIGWGALSGLTGVVRSVPGLIAVRLLLGVVEGCVLPAMLVFLTRWFTRTERSRANALLIMANPVMMVVASVLSPFIIEHFNRHPTWGFEGWQWMFIVEGLPSIVWAFLWAILADERPSAARWLGPPEVAAVQARLDAEQSEIKHVANYWAAFLDVRVILLALMYLCVSSTSYGFMFWLPTIVKAGARQGIAAEGLLSAIPYFIGMFSMYAVSYWSDRLLVRKPFVWGSMFVGAAALMVSYLAGVDHFWIAFGGLIVVGSCIYTFCSPLWAWMADMLPRHVVGESMALVNSAGSVGGFFGTLFVGLLISRFGTAAGFAYMAASFAAAGMLTLMVRSTTRVDRGFPVALATTTTTTTTHDPLNEAT